MCVCGGGGAVERSEVVFVYWVMGDAVPDIKLLMRDISTRIMHYFDKNHPILNSLHNFLISETKNERDMPGE